MPFSDTSAKSGILQAIEFWTNLGDGGITNDATLLKIFTARVNDAFDRLMPLLLSYSDKLRFDDSNNTDLPSGTLSMVSGQPDYTISVDDNGLKILNITDVRILTSATGATFITLEKLTIDDARVLDAMKPNSTDTGIPTAYLERGNTIFLYPNPNYSATNGIRIFFEREASYFASTDTTKQPGIPRPFHTLIPLYASYDWLLVNKPANAELITRIEAQIRTREQSLKDLISMRYPTRQRIGVSRDSNQ